MAALAPPPIVSPAPPSDDDDDNATSDSSNSESDSDATPIPSSVPAPPAPASEPVTGTDVAGDVTAVPVKDERKAWERAWSIKELKSVTECWTLAADAGVRHLKLAFIYINSIPVLFHSYKF